MTARAPGNAWLTATAWFVALLLLHGMVELLPPALQSAREHGQVLWPTLVPPSTLLHALHFALIGLMMAHLRRQPLGLPKLPLLLMAVLVVPAALLPHFIIPDLELNAYLSAYDQAKTPITPALKPGVFNSLGQYTVYYRHKDNATGMGHGWRISNHEQIGTEAVTLADSGYYAIVDGQLRMKLFGVSILSDLAQEGRRRDPEALSQMHISMDTLVTTLDLGLSSFSDIEGYRRAFPSSSSPSLWRQQDSLRHLADSLAILSADTLQPMPAPADERAHMEYKRQHVLSKARGNVLDRLQDQRQNLLTQLSSRFALSLSALAILLFALMAGRKLIHTPAWTRWLPAAVVLGSFAMATLLRIALPGMIVIHPFGMPLVWLLAILALALLRQRPALSTSDSNA